MASRDSPLRLEVPPDGPFELSVPLRRPMRLRGCALVTRLIRYGSYVAPPEAFVARVHQEVVDALDGEPSRLSADVLEIDRPGSSPLLIDVDLRNSQFIAADVSPGCYPNGYEPEITALIDALIPDDGVFFDVGANWGYFSLILAERRGFGGRIYAFEPAAGPRGDLRRIIEACGHGDRLTVRDEALGATAGEAALSRPLWSGMASILDGDGVEPVRLARLDDLDLPSADLIKIDVEGAEGAVLAGAQTYLRRCNPAVVFECRRDSPGGEWDRPFPVLAAAGYKTFALAAEVGAAAGGPACRLVATPMRAEERDRWPLHLNVLALKCQGDAAPGPG